MGLITLLGYEVHLESYGWRQGIVYDGMATGTVGRSIRIEAIRVYGLPGGFQDRGHVQDVGWQGWVGSSEVAGTTGQARRLEALQFRYTGSPLSLTPQVWGRTHVESFGWLEQCSAMEPSLLGTTGLGKRMEAIQMILVLPDDHPDFSTSNRSTLMLAAAAGPEHPSIADMARAVFESAACGKSAGLIAACLMTEGAVCGVAELPLLEAATICASAVADGTKFMPDDGSGGGSDHDHDHVTPGGSPGDQGSSDDEKPIDGRKGDFPGGGGGNVG